MGQFIDIPRMDGNARFNTLQVKLIESSSITRTVVADDNGVIKVRFAGDANGVWTNHN